MTMNYHTPGPWVAKPRRPERDHSDDGWWDIFPDREPEFGGTWTPIATLDHHGDGHLPTRQRTARDASLIAATPALLEALTKLSNEMAGCWSAFETQLRDVMGHTNYNVAAERIAQARDALAKATT